MEQKTKPSPEFEFSVCMSIDLPAGDDRVDRSLLSMNKLIAQLQGFKGMFWMPHRPIQRFEINEHLGPYEHRIEGADGVVLCCKDVTFWNFDFTSQRIETSQEVPILDITESSDGTNKHEGYDMDGWDTVIHRKLAGIISRELFDELVEILELYIGCLNTGGMLGGLGTEPWYGNLPAVSLEGDAEGSIINMYACPFPANEDDELWLLEGRTREEVEASQELQDKMWKRAQSFFEDYPNWWR